MLEIKLDFHKYPTSSEFDSLEQMRESYVIYLTGDSRNTDLGLVEEIKKMYEKTLKRSNKIKNCYFHYECRVDWDTFVFIFKNPLAKGQWINRPNSCFRLQYKNGSNEFSVYSPPVNWEMKLIDKKDLIEKGGQNA